MNNKPIVWIVFGKDGYRHCFDTREEARRTIKYLKLYGHEKIYQPIKYIKDSWWENNR